MTDKVYSTISFSNVTLKDVLSVTFKVYVLFVNWLVTSIPLTFTDAILYPVSGLRLKVILSFSWILISMVVFFTVWSLKVIIPPWLAVTETVNSLVFVVLFSTILLNFFQMSADW